MNKKINIIMSTLNKNQKKIDYTIKSILMTEYPNYEVIIVNDSSSELLVGEKFKKKITILNNYGNIGLTKSLIKAVKFSNCSYIARVDEGDKIDPKRMRKQIDFLEKNKDFCLVACISKIFTQIDGKRTFLKYSPYFDQKQMKNILKYSNPFVHGSIMIRVDKYQQVGGYDSKIKVAQDINLYLRLKKIGKLKILKQCLHEHTFNLESSITFTKNKESIYSAAQSRLLYLNIKEKITLIYFFGLFRDIIFLIIPNKILMLIRLYKNREMV